MSALLTLEDAQAQLLSLAKRDQFRLTKTDQIIDRRYLAQDLVAQRTQPTADLSAMDGYAISGDGPWQMVGESRAGEPFTGAISEGECTRISTGAHMPSGSDRVLIQENAAAQGTLIHLAEGESIPEPGRHVRKRGFDFEVGDTLLGSGTLMGPAQIALARSAGYGEVALWGPPTVGILESGDELCADPSQCSEGQIPASNGEMLAAMLRPMVGDVHRMPPVADSLADLAKALRELDDCRIVVTSGGASVGDHDLIQQALIEWGAELSFWKVAIKPGKPLMVATRRRTWGEQIILGLPGNPVSSFVTGFLFALPLVRGLMGDRSPLPTTVETQTSVPLPAIGKRREFLRGIFDGTSVRLAASQDSSALRALADANCLIDRPAGSAEAVPGSKVNIYLLTNG